MARQNALVKEKEIPSVVGKKIRYEHLRRIEPITQVQEQVFTEYNRGQNLVLHGCPGTGKTFLAMYLALREILLRESQYEKIVVVRSAVPTREVGFLPGTLEEKIEVYELPYHAIFKELIMNVPELMEKAKSQNLYQFMTTSFIRGITLHKSIVIVDECQNLDWHEIYSITSRLGDKCKIIFCGDVSQTDLDGRKDVSGLGGLLKVTSLLEKFSTINFGEDDIVRSDLVKSWIIACNKMKLSSS